VGAIAPEIAFPRIVCGARQQVFRVRRGSEQRAVGEVPILIAVAEHEFAQGHAISVGQLGDAGAPFTIPVELWLADPVDKAERLTAEAVSGTAASQAQAAAAFSMRNTRNAASLRCPWPNRTSP